MINKFKCHLKKSKITIIHSNDGLYVKVGNATEKEASDNLKIKFILQKMNNLI